MMLVFVVIAGLYLAVALLCAYVEAVAGYGGEIGPLWIVWPALLPILLIFALFEAAANLGERHR